MITGATDGLGLALAHLYHARGERMILVGRRAPHELDPVQFPASAYCRAELAHPEAPEVIERFLRDSGSDHLDLLIHNAGVGYFGSIEQQSNAALRGMVDVNLRAPIALTHQLLPYLARARGRIVFISSVVAALPAPDYAVYAATKSALEAFARNLRTELRDSVAVQIIAPGAIRTTMHTKSGAPLATIGWEHFPAAALVAQRIVRSIDRGASDATIGASTRWLRFGGRYMPRLVDWIAASRRR